MHKPAIYEEKSQTPDLIRCPNNFCIFLAHMKNLTFINSQSDDFKFFLLCLKSVTLNMYTYLWYSMCYEFIDKKKVYFIAFSEILPFPYHMFIMTVFLGKSRACTRYCSNKCKMWPWLDFRIHFLGNFGLSPNLFSLTQIHLQREDIIFISI